VGLALGLTQRKDALTFKPDQTSLSGDLSGFGGASVQVDNSLRVAEAYSEVRVPIVQDMPWIKDLSFEGGWRYSDYSTHIHANTWKTGLQWAPSDDIRFRISYQKAIRAPNILELYSPSLVTNTSVVSEDPCAAGAVAPATLQQCLRTGITAAQYGNIPQCPAGQCAILEGGNTALKPEEAKTFSVGFTTRPHWVPGLTASVDYFDIKLRDVIGAIPINVTLTRCLNTGLPEFCSLVVRNPTSGILFGTTVGAGGFINGANINVGASRNRGIDVQASYNLPLADWGVDGWGGLSFSMNGSYLIEASTVPLPGDPAYDCVFLYGPACGNSINPRWRHQLRANWTMPWVDATLSVAWRYIGSAKFEQDTNEPNLGKGTTLKANHVLPERSYIDLAGIWRVSDKFSVRGGVNNVFDQDPPIINSGTVGTGLPNTFPVYDVLGRQFFVGLTANF
jgi:outer membrane receptor protein involved in Fe transport